MSVKESVKIAGKVNKKLVAAIFNNKCKNMTEYKLVVVGAGGVGECLSFS